MNAQKGKTVPVEYQQVVSAYQKARRGGKASGIDNMSWEEFDKNLENNLYIIWNRLASGSYHPQAVKEVAIPKKDGTQRELGIPTLRERIAQTVVKDCIEERIDKMFHENSYGYRPLKSAHDAVEQVRQNCYKQDWVIDMDIRKFFDEIDHELLMKALNHVIQEKWILTLIERWLQAPVQKLDGSLQPKAGRGTPQGGVISPLLANLYLHYAFDVWLGKHHPDVHFVRYADDIVIHCKSKEEAETVLSAVKARLEEVKLRLNEDKTRIVYCKDYKRRLQYDAVKFDFLGFSFQPRQRISKRDNKPFAAFTAEISAENQKRIRDDIKCIGIWRNPTVEIPNIAVVLNAKLRGWINYYGMYSKKKLRFALWTVDLKLVKWLRRKYKLNYHEAITRLKAIQQQDCKLFYHWEKGYCLLP